MTENDPALLVLASIFVVLAVALPTFGVLLYRELIAPRLRRWQMDRELWAARETQIVLSMDSARERELRAWVKEW